MMMENQDKSKYYCNGIFCKANLFMNNFHFRAKVEMSLCGGLDRNGPNEKEFSDHLVEYSEVRSLSYLKV